MIRVVFGYNSDDFVKAKISYIVYKHTGTTKEAKENESIKITRLKNFPKLMDHIQTKVWPHVTDETQFELVFPGEGADCVKTYIEIKRQ